MLSGFIHVCICIALDALIKNLDQRIKKKKPTKIMKSVGDPVYRPTPGGLKKWMINPSNDVICECYNYYGMHV